MKSTVIKCDAYRNRSSIVCTSVVKGKEVVGKHPLQTKPQGQNSRWQAKTKLHLQKSNCEQKTNKNKAVDKIREMTYNVNNN